MWSPFRCFHVQFVVDPLIILKKKMSGSQPKKYFCPVCGKSFSRSYDLLRHSSCHTGENPYQCTICDSAHSTKSQLLRHSKTHSKTKLYKFNYCDQSFIRKERFLRNKIQHAKDKLFQCNIILVYLCYKYKCL